MPGAMSQDESAYLRLWRTGELPERCRDAVARLSNCMLCGHQCGMNRASGELGRCSVGGFARVAAAHPHFGEERALVGSGGSGTIFFTRCSMGCVYCQNADISTGRVGRNVLTCELAEIMLDLQAMGCHNINLVSPTHVVPQIIEAVALAAEEGLRVPLVYNTGGYDSVETLRLLDGIVDIYMPDMKYSDEGIARALSDAPGYPKINRAAVREMHRQVGDLTLDEKGVARRGLLVRHLVLPNGFAGTAAVVRFLAEEISPDTYLNVMDQYRPLHLAECVPELNRHITHKEFEDAVRLAREAGLHRLDDRRRGAFLAI